MRGRPKVAFPAVRSVVIWDSGKRSGFAVLAMAVFAAALLWGGRSTPHREIEAIGVVASENSGIDGDDTLYTYTFEGGRTFSLRYKGHIATGGPAVGDLLIAGTRPDNWTLVATPRDPASGFRPGCFGLGSQAGHDTKTTVELDFGVTLQKAPDFDPTGHGALGPFGALGVNCLDRQGRVTQINA